MTAMPWCREPALRGPTSPSARTALGPHISHRRSQEPNHRAYPRSRLGGSDARRRANGPAPGSAADVGRRAFSAPMRRAGLPTTTPGTSAIPTEVASYLRAQSKVQSGLDPASVATQRTTWTRESTPSLLKMLVMWLSTVRSEMNNCEAASAFEAPSAMSRATSISRRDRPP